MNTKRFRRLWLTVLAMLTALTLGSIPAAAAEDGDTGSEGNVISVNVTGTYGQTEARSMLAMINAFRTGEEAWYYTDETKTTKYTYNTPGNDTLSELSYDYDLEEIAMQRAMETALQKGHVRPKADPSSKDTENDYVFTLIDGYSTAGENLAYGYNTCTTAEQAFEVWKETDEPYSGQGHRRNMLDPDFTAVGISHVSYNGSEYWVQVFRAPTVNTTETPANDSESTKSVEILESNIIDRNVSVSPASLSVPYEGSIILPEVSCSIQLNNTWPGDPCPVTVPLEWSVTSGSDCISLDSASGKISGIKCGKATLSVTALGETVAVPVEVTPQPIDTAVVTLDSGADLTYTGAAITPTVTVRLADKVLTAEDYTVTYSNNTNAGTAAITVSGRGNYGGSASSTFQIQQKAMTAVDCVITAIPNQAYTGASITPSVSVSFGGKALAAGVDYTVAYSNNINAGEAAATITAAGNYSGDLGTAPFTITPADLANCTVKPIAKQTYTGSAITPAVTVLLNGNTLVAGEDYTVSYTNNTEIGTATVTVTGIRNYTGTCTATFAIAEPEKTAEPPKKGTVQEDAATGAKYRITDSSASAAAVEYMAPTSKKKTSVMVPDTVKIGNTLCKVTSVAPNAFQNNKKLKKVVIGKNVTTIGKNAFRGCSKLTTVKFNAKTSAIGAGAFYGCTALKSITIPASVISIGKQAFYKCTRLKNILIQTKKLTGKSVGKMAFSGISSKAVIKVPAGKRNAYRTLLKKKGLRVNAKVK